jgi:ribosomal protein S18 acetylase RimI-like enzyme
MNYRFATSSDVPGLALMNSHPIRDEGHQNPMTLAELERRMETFLAGEHTAVIFEEEGNPLGYALFKREESWAYLRQFFVSPERRRRGIGRQALAWLQANAWRGVPSVRLDVLVNNASGIAFWKSAGFTEYCITMERH